MNKHFSVTTVQNPTRHIWSTTSTIIPDLVDMHTMVEELKFEYLHILKNGIQIPLNSLRRQVAHVCSEWGFLWELWGSPGIKLASITPSARRRVGVIASTIVRRKLVWWAVVSRRGATGEGTSYVHLLNKKSLHYIPSL